LQDVDWLTFLEPSSVQKSMAYSTVGPIFMQQAMAISIKRSIVCRLTMVVALICGTGFLISPSLADTSYVSPKVCFSPQGHCASIILDEIGRAQHSIRVQAYSFTSRDIADALIAAGKRGVDVAVIVDKSQTSERYSVLNDLRDANLPLFVDYCCAIAHNKVMIVDEHRIITGSYNFTKAAESKNAENLLLLDDPDLARSYIENWNRHRAGAEKFAMR